MKKTGMGQHNTESQRPGTHADNTGLTWRSRLDEEWAIFLTALDLPFAYYPGEINFAVKKFALSALWLPRQEIWLQAVLRKPAPGVAQQAMRLADETGYDVALFIGRVALTEDESAYVYSPLSLHTDLFTSHMKWAECLRCGAIGLIAQGRTEQCPGHCLPMSGAEDQVAHNTPRLLQAYAQAHLPRALPFPLPSQEDVDFTHPSSIIAFSKRDT